MTKVINSITVAALTAVQARTINDARAHSDAATRKQIKREVFSNVKAKYGIDQSIRTKANTTGETQKGYLVLHNKAGQAFRLGADGRWDGTMVNAADLFPPAAPAQAPAQSTAPAPAASSVFDAPKWYRLDPESVATALTNAVTDIVEYDLEAGAPLPDPHLMLAGRTDLAITADGSIYRKM